MANVRVDLKHKMILYKKPRIQRIKEAIDEEVKLDNESNGRTIKRSSWDVSKVKIDDTKSVKNLIQSFKEREIA